MADLDVPEEFPGHRFAVRSAVSTGWQEREPSEQDVSEVSKRSAPDVGDNDVASSVDNLDAFVYHDSNPHITRIMQQTLGKAALDPSRKHVSREVFLDYIREEEDNQSKCLQFPIIVLYFVMFVFVVLSHEDIQDVASVERNVRNMVEGSGFEGLRPDFPVSGHKILDDVSTVGDIWLFLYDAFVPLFLQADRGTAAEDRHRVLRYNQLVGGVQLQQLRRPKKSCAEAHPMLGPKTKDSNTNPILEGLSCYPWDQYARECFGPWNTSQGFCPDSYVNQAASRRLLAAQHWSSVLGRRLFQSHHTAKVQGRTWQALSGAYLGAFEGGLFTVPLHEHEGHDAALERVLQLQARGWLDTATAWFGAKLLLLNPDLAVYCHVIVSVWFPPSGALVPAVTITTFPAEPYLDRSTWVADIIWLLLWLHLFGRSFLSLLRAIFTRTLTDYAKNFWHWLDWFSALGGLAIMICWGVFLLLLQSVKSRAMEVVLDRPSVESGSATAFASETERANYVDSTDRMHAEAAQLAAFIMVYRVFICWYTLLISIRFFQAFMAQPRLSIVTKTLQHSLEDIFHFFIVLFLVFLTYAVAGMFLFGHRMLEFSALRMAFHQCFLIMLGSFAYNELANDYPLTAALWFWTFTILVSLVMLNMALAIVLDIYTEVKTDSDLSDELWTQARKAIGSIWSRRKWVKLEKVAECIEQVDSDTQWLNQDALQAEVEGMDSKQAAELIGFAEQREERLQNKGVSMSDAMKMVGWIKLAVQRLEGQIDEIATLEREERELMEGAESAQFGDGEFLSLDPSADRKLKVVQRRLSQMEEFLSESMSSTVSRGKDMRNRLISIETFLKGQQDFASASNYAPEGRDHPKPGLNTFAPGGPALSSNVRTVTFSA